MDEVDWPGRAPAAMVELPDGRIGICGFLDNELRAYDIVDNTLERAGTIMPLPHQRRASSTTAPSSPSPRPTTA